MSQWTKQPFTFGAAGPATVEPEQGAWVSWKAFQDRFRQVFPPLTRRQKSNIAVYKAAKRRCQRIAHRVPHYLT